MTKDGFSALVGQYLDGFCPKDKDERSAFNKAKHALAGALLSEQKRSDDATKEKLKTKGGVKPTVDTSDLKLLSPEERAEQLAKLLDSKLLSGDISASEIRELKDIFNLKQKDQDLHIQVTDFSSVNPELAEVAKAVDWYIEDFNK